MLPTTRTVCGLTMKPCATDFRVPAHATPPSSRKSNFWATWNSSVLQKVDLGLPGAGPFHRSHIDAMLTHIPGERLCHPPRRRCSYVDGHDIEPLVEVQAKHEMEIQTSAFLGTSPIRQYTEGWTMEKLMTTMEKAVSYAVENDVPVMFVTEDTTRSNPEDVKMIYQRAMELGVRRLCVCDTCGHVSPTASRSSSPSSTRKSSRTQAISAAKSR